MAVSLAPRNFAVDLFYCWGGGAFAARGIFFDLDTIQHHNLSSSAIRRSLLPLRVNRDGRIFLSFGLIEIMVWHNALCMAFVLPFLPPSHDFQTRVSARPRTV
jgi:hypothetical protein